MKRLAAVAVLLTAGLSGCMTMGASFPAPSAGFTAHEIYAVPSAKAWEGVVEALNDNHLAIASADHNTRQIQTGYIAGPDSIQVLTTQSTRYRYTIVVSAVSPKKTKIDVSCAIEDSMDAISGGAETQYHDATTLNPQLETSLRNWLYEQIDHHLS